MLGEKITILKLTPQEEEVWQYEGKVISVDDEKIVVEAFFNREDFLFHGMMLKKDDRFLESYYCKHWYNIFEIYDRDDGLLKGWYCNVTKPATIQDGVIRYVDLALDLLVFPDGRQFVLDEDEFAALNLDESIRKQACLGLAALQQKFKAQG